MLWPIGYGVFHNDPVIVSSLFSHTEIIMVVYDPIRNDKKFLCEFISRLILNDINYNTNNHPIRLHKQFY